MNLSIWRFRFFTAWYWTDRFFGATHYRELTGEGMWEFWTCCVGKFQMHFGWLGNRDQPRIRY